MQTPEYWINKHSQSGAFDLIDTTDEAVSLVLAIQRDAIETPMVSLTAEQEISILKDTCDQLEVKNTRLENELERLHEKLAERKHHLRAANKGAERNAVALSLSVSQYHAMVVSDRRTKERDECKHKTILWNWLLLPDSELCEKANISKLDVTAARSLLKAMLGTSILQHL